jgi:outer membrane protein assembly factor BamD
VLGLLYWGVYRILSRPPRAKQVNVLKQNLTGLAGVLSKGLTKGLWAGVVAASLAAGLSGCGTTPSDEFAGVSADKLYADAREEAADGNFEAAIKRYEKVEARASGTLMAQQAQLELAYAYYKTGERAQGLAKIERFIRLHPTSPAMDYALYLQGLINFNDDLGLFGRISKQDISERDQQASRDAYESFKQVSERFPNSKFAGDARLRMNHIVNSLAAGEVHVARYYFRRGAYLAAANRAQVAVSEFRNSPAVEEALYIMVKSYEQLAMPQLRDDALRVLKQNFPNSSFLNQGFAASTKPWWQLW